jgi:hypothetical protein
MPEVAARIEDANVVAADLDGAVHQDVANVDVVSADDQVAQDDGAVVEVFTVGVVFERAEDLDVVSEHDDAPVDAPRRQDQRGVVVSDLEVAFERRIEATSFRALVVAADDLDGQSIGAIAHQDLDDLRRFDILEKDRSRDGIRFDLQVNVTGGKLSNGEAQIGRKSNVVRLSLDGESDGRWRRVECAGAVLDLELTDEGRGFS